MLQEIGDFNQPTATSYANDKDTRGSMETAEINDHLSSINNRDEDLSIHWYKDLATLPPVLKTPPDSSFELEVNKPFDPDAFSTCLVRTSTPTFDSDPTPPSYENGTSSGVATTHSSMYPRQHVSGYTFSSSGRSWTASQREVPDASSSSISPIQHGPAANTRVAPPRPPRPQDDTMSFIYYDLSCLFASSRPGTAGSADIERPLSSNKEVIFLQ